MAILEFRGKRWTSPGDIKTVLAEYQIPFEVWGVRKLEDTSPETVVRIYADDIKRMKVERGYESEDLISLDPHTPNLDATLAKFVVEHHHTDDEVRFVVAGEGVFEINVSESERVKFTAQPGDFIVVPAWRRHLFYLTDKRSIRCIRLFKDSKGWEALYQPASRGSQEHSRHFNSAVN